MLRVLIATALTLLFACSSDKTNNNNTNDTFNNMVQASNENSDDEYRLTCKYNSFDTIVDVIFNDTSDTISECQKKNYENFISKQDLLTPEILEKVFEYYKEAYPDYYEGWSYSKQLTEKQIEENLPKPTTSENLKKYITPLSVYIANKAECEEGTIGIYFDCTWDIKRSLGVVIKNWKVADAGTGDLAFLF